MDISNDPLYPFGYGLSYTTFNFSALQVNKSELHGDGDRLTVSVVVSNSGQYDGEEVVQLYIGDPAASVTRAVRELKAFKKVFVAAGARQKVTFVVTTDELKFYDSNLSYIWEEGVFNIYVGPDSANTQSVQVYWYK